MNTCQLKSCLREFRPRSEGEVKKRGGKPQRYCSPECLYKSHLKPVRVPPPDVRHVENVITLIEPNCGGWAVHMICLECGGKARYSGSRLNRKGRTRFYCSARCASKGHGKWLGENHPRGMLGKPQSEKARRATSIASKKMWNDPDHRVNSASWRQAKTVRQSEARSKKPLSQKMYSRGKVGTRKDLNQFFRSRYEANTARYLNLCGIRWIYEPQVFRFEKIKQGTMAYRPDFWCPEIEKWIEVKGWLTQKGHTALKRFMKYYPKEADRTILLVDNFGCKAHAQLLDAGFKEFWFYKKIRSQVADLLPLWEF